MNYPDLFDQMQNLDEDSKNQTIKDEFSKLKKVIDLMEKRNNFVGPRIQIE